MAKLASWDNLWTTFVEPAKLLGLRVAEEIGVERADSNRMKLKENCRDGDSAFSQHHNDDRELLFRQVQNFASASSVGEFCWRILLEKIAGSCQSMPPFCLAAGSMPQWPINGSCRCSLLTYETAASGAVCQSVPFAEMSNRLVDRSCLSNKVSLFDLETPGFGQHPGSNNRLKPEWKYPWIIATDHSPQTQTRRTCLAVKIGAMSGL